MIYVSITGLKIKNIFSWFKFWLMAIPAFRWVQKAKGISFCEKTKVKNYHHTLSVWESKNDMLNYKNQVLILKLCNHLMILQLVKFLVMKQI